MIKYSHVRLLILCDAEGVDDINRHLGVDPSDVTFDDGADPPATGLTHTWCLDSPMGIDGDPTARLAALADVIEPFAAKLVSLDTRFRRFIDIVYHVTPQHVGGITGEFDWFRCPAQLMLLTELGRALGRLQYVLDHLVEQPDEASDGSQRIAGDGGGLESS